MERLCEGSGNLGRQVHRSMAFILKIVGMEAKPVQKANEFNYVDSVLRLIWTPVHVSSSFRSRAFCRDDGSFIVREVGARHFGGFSAG